MRLVISTIVFLLLLLSNVVHAQHLPTIPYESFGWEQIQLVDHPLSDTLFPFLVVTNRPFQADNEKGIYFPNAIAVNRKVQYIQVAFSGNRCFIHTMDSFEQGIQAIDDGKDVLLFIHGQGKSFPRSIYRASQIKKRYDVTLIVFDWPARNSNFNKSLARVRRCGSNFYNLLLDLKGYKEEYFHEHQHLSVMAHSLGNYFVSHMVVNGNWQYIEEPFIDNLLLNAPAIRAKEHGGIISLINISKNKYVILNKNDRVLKGANALTSGKMLGNLVIPPLGNNTSYIHFTAIAGKEHTYYVGYHQFEHENPAVFELYNHMIHGHQVDFSKTYFKRIGENQYGIQ